MASKTVAAIRPQSTPATQSWSDDLVPYIDSERDYRDTLLLDAIKTAIHLIDDGEELEMAASVLRLARDRLMGSWPKTDVKFTAQIPAEVGHA